MTGLNELQREYEARRFPASCRLDLQGEGPDTARQRALQWIQSVAHERPGTELLLVVERGRASGQRGRSVRQSVERLLAELDGGLIAWWQPFGPGSLALRLADLPRMAPRGGAAPPDPADDGRTPETAGAAAIDADADIPAELLPLAQRAAELRRERERLSVGLSGIVLRRIWIEAQALAMTERVHWRVALERLLREEERRVSAGE